MWNYYKYKIWALDRLGDLLLRRGRRDESETVLRRALKLRAVLPEPDPKPVSTLKRLIRNLDLLGQLAYSAGRPSEAERAYRRAIAEGDALAARLPWPSREDVAPSDTLARLGLLLLTTDRAKEAEAVEQDALARLALRSDLKADRVYWQSVRTFAYQALAAARLGIGRNAAAAEDLRAARTLLSPEVANRVGSWVTRAEALAGSDTGSDAVRLSREITSTLIATLPVLPSNTLELARVRNEMAWKLVTWSDEYRDPALAVRLARQALELDPDSSGYWNTLGLALHQTGDQPGAVVAIGRSMDLGGGVIEDWLILAMAHGHLGDLKAAARWYEKARDWMDRNPGKLTDWRLVAPVTDLLGLPRRPR